MKIRHVKSSYTTPTCQDAYRGRGSKSGTLHYHMVEGPEEVKENLLSFCGEGTISDTFLAKGKVIKVSPYFGWSNKQRGEILLIILEGTSGDLFKVVTDDTGHRIGEDVDVHVDIRSHEGEEVELHVRAPSSNVRPTQRWAEIAQLCEQA